MNIIDTLITDRTNDDVLRVRELKKKISSSGLSSLTTAEHNEYFAGMKGAYNATDLNRVGEACNYVYELMRNFGMISDDDDIEYSAQKTNWKLSDILNAAEMNTYLVNIIALRDASGSTLTMPYTMNNFSFDSANRIEKMIYEAYNKVIENEKKLIFCGEVFCGEV